MAQLDQESSSGSFVVKSGGESTTVKAERWDYSSKDELQFWQDGKVVAIFRWWDSIVAKD